MKKLLPFEEIRRYLVDDIHVRDEIVRTFKSDALMVLRSLARGEDPDLPDADVDTFLLDLLHNDGRLYKRYTAHGSYGGYHIDIRGLGGVYFYWAPEFDTTGYFLSVDDASNAIEWDWADNLASSTGRTYRPPFLRSSEATEKALSEIDVSGSLASRKISADRHHFFHGELTDAPGRNESWDHYLRYRGSGRWDLITESRDFSGMEYLPESKEVMNTRQLVQWAIERDEENEESSQHSGDTSGDDGVDESQKSLGPYAKRLREVALVVGATYCVKCLDGWEAGTWPAAPGLRILSVGGVTRRGVWIRIYHDVYTVETNRGAAYMYPPDQDGYAKVVLETEGSMSPGRKVKLNKHILNQVAENEPDLQKLKG
jgi:hypothetical protein